MLNKRRLFVAMGLIIAAAFMCALVISQVMQRKDNEPRQSQSPTKQQGDPTNEHEFYDVDFAQKMIVHSQQAVLLAELAISKSSDQALIGLANGVKARQLAITREYTNLLDSWNEEYSNLSDFPEMDGHAMYPTHPGMALAIEIAELSKLQGPDFDNLYVDMMLNHHEGAIEMAESRTGQKVTNTNLSMLRTKTIEYRQNELNLLKDFQNRK